PPCMSQGGSMRRCGNQARRRTVTPSSNLGGSGWRNGRPPLAPESHDACHDDFDDQVVNTLQDPNGPRPPLEGHLRRFERCAEAEPYERTERDRVNDRRGAET